MNDKQEEIWQQEYSLLRSEMELHRIEWIRTKRCDCEEVECIHYKEEEKEMFRGRLVRSLAKGILLNALTDLKTLSSREKT